MFNNQALFNYIQAALNDNGGDGNVFVALKQQKVIDVAKEYEWLIKNNSALERREESDEEIFFSDGSNENVAFWEWKEYGKFQKKKAQNPFVDSDFLGWDIVIVTW